MQIHIQADDQDVNADLKNKYVYSLKVILDSNCAIFIYGMRVVKSFQLHAINLFL